MKDELSKLKEKVETVTTATVDGMVKKVISYASRPVTEFNKHEVVEMMETLYHTAHDRSDTKEGYFRLAYHTIRGKIELPKEQLRHLVLRMVGDKDHERIFDIVAKVEKQSRSTARNRFQDSSPYQRPRSQSIDWLWERNDLFDERMMAYSKNRIQNQVKWLDSRGSPVEAGGGNDSRRGITWEETLSDRLTTGAISLLGRVGEVSPPHLILPLTVEPTKPRLCHDARFLNLWMKDTPFTLDRLTDLPRYVSKDSYQTVLDDKSGYDHILLTDSSRNYFGFQWGGWLFTYNTLPFGWKISPYVYHTTGLMASNFFRSIGIPCILYIDDRHTGQLQVSLMSGEYSMLECDEERRKKAAGSALFLVVYYLVRLGYLLGLAKSTLIPIQEILQGSVVSVKALQRLAGKCVSFSLAFPAARLFTREMNCAISKGQKSSRPVFLKDALRKEIAYWLFLENWDNPLPWRDERHYRVSVATDASGSGWGGQLISPVKKELADYWNAEELHWDIATKEATAVDRLLLSCKNELTDAWVDAWVDNQAVIQAWNHLGCRSVELNNAMKNLFYTTSRLNISLHMHYVPSKDNPADKPSRRLSTTDIFESSPVQSSPSPVHVLQYAGSTDWSGPYKRLSFSAYDTR
ncbi:hypothetical protein QZH41_000492 [Actinostola sp. cb2023]|nr:hypothetical protein QZH41_000492 [Actinostola sp. cb2023]